MNRSPRFPASRLAAAGLLAGVAAAATAAPPAGQIFTCVNAAGRALTSDRLIGECMDREQRVLGRDGTLLRIVPPQLTADERAEKETRERRILAEKEARAEAVRRDKNLLQRFPNLAAHDKAREAALDDMRTAIKLSELRQQDLAKERKPLLDESEFYKGRALPPKLKQQLDANEAATTAQAEVQANQNAEMERMNKLYDAEQARLKKLWAGAAPGSVGLATADPSDPALAPATRAKPVSTAAGRGAKPVAP